MTDQDKTVTENELLAFVDGQLDPARRAEVAAFLADNPDTAAEIAAWQNQNQAIRTLFAPLEDAPVPAGMSARALARGLDDRRRNTWRLAAAALVLVALGAGLGYGLHATIGTAAAPTDRLIASAVDAHELFVVQRRHPVEVAASEAPHLTTWLSNSLKRSLVAPDLGRLGYRLVGGRLLPGDAGPAAQIMYETADGNRITLYITQRLPGDQADDKRTAADGLNALYWATNTITCTIVGNLDTAEMNEVAATVFPALAGADTALDPRYSGS